MELPLREIHLPEAIPWWPPAFGWGLVFAAACLLVWGAIFVLKKSLRPHLKKEASKVLDEIEKRFQENEDGAECLSELSKFLRRAMLSKQGAVHIGGVTGEAWLQLLDQQLGEPQFSQGAGRLLLSGPYVGRADGKEVADLIQLCRLWVEKL